jgi:adenylate cyclase
VVARLANALSYELVRAEAETGAHSKNPDVIDLDMRGNEAIWRFQQQPTKDSNIAIRALFEQALKIDPSDPDALNGDAITYEVDYAYGSTNPETDYEAKILGQADRAIALAPGTPWSYSTKSTYLTITGRPNEGLRVANAALAINPNYAAEYAYRSIAESHLHQFEQAKSDVQQAMRLSPRDPRMGQWHVYMEEAELGLGHFDTPIEEANMALDSQRRLRLVDFALERVRDGQMEVRPKYLISGEARRLNPKLSVKYLIGLKYFLQPWLDALRKAGLPEE